MAIIDSLKNKFGEILYPRTKQEAVEGLIERFLNVEKPDITETTETTMPNSCEGRLLFKEIVGKTEKLTSTGANLFNPNAISKGYELNQNGSTSPNNNYWVSDYIKVDGGKSYYLTKGLSKNGVSNCFYDANKTFISSVSKNEGLLTTPSNARYVRFNGTDTQLIMFNEGGTALPYEPYGVGTPFIRSVEISRIKTHRKNLLENNATSQTKSGISFDVNEDKSVTINGTSTDGSSWILLKDNISLKSGQILNGVTGGGTDPLYANYFIQLWDNNANGIIVNHGDGEYVVESDYDNVGVFVGVKDGSTVEDVTIYPMIRNADIEDATYEPYCGSSITFSKPIELNKIGDVQDVIVDGKLTKRFGRKVLTGDESWTKNGAGTQYYAYCEGGSKATNSIIMSSHFSRGIWGTQIKDSICLGNSVDSVIGISTESFASVDALKSFLKSNRVEIVYELATPITDMPMADQIALNSIKSCDGTTYLEFDSLLQPEFVAEYGTSKVGGKTLEALAIARNNEIRISSVEATVVNNI